jgi:hypothetical protein
MKKCSHKSALSMRITFTRRHIWCVYPTILIYYKLLTSSSQQFYEQAPPSEMIIVLQFAAYLPFALRALILISALWLPFANVLSALPGTKNQFRYLELPLTFLTQSQISAAQVQLSKSKNQPAFGMPVPNIHSKSNLLPAAKNQILCKSVGA